MLRETVNRRRKYGGGVVALAALSLAVIPAITGSAIGAEEEPSGSEQVVVSKVAHNGTKGYLEVDGKPFPISGVQNFGVWQIYGHGLDPDNIPINQDNPILDEDWLENAFEKTAAAGFKTAQVELAWKTIQPSEEGVYDWHIIDKYVEWAEKYDLKLDFVWFGSNGCGGAVIENEFRGYIATVPTYLEDPKYWHPTDRVSGDQRHPPRLPIVGETYYEDAKYFFEQEQAAVHALFNHLAEVDTTHQTILFQLYNEPDAYPYFSTGGVETRTWRTLVDELGAAIKTSNYVVATRMNFQRGNFANDDRRARFATFLSPNVDFIGVDSYDHNPLNQVNYINMVHETGSPIAYIPETGGNSNEKTPVLASVLAAGGFVDFWMLNDAWATTLSANGGVRSGFALYGDDSNIADFHHYYEWELGEIPDMPVSTQRLKNFLTGMEKMPQLVAKSEVGTIVAFNASVVAQQQPTTTTETVALGGSDVTFSTTTKDVGLAIFDPESESTYLTSDTFGEVTYSLGMGKMAEAGEFDDDGIWVADEVREVADDGSIVVRQGEVVRVFADKEPSLPVDISTDLRCVAGKSILAVTVFNESDIPVEAMVESGYGKKTFADVRPGKTGFHSFTTRLTELPAGNVKVTAIGSVDGEIITSETTAEYPSGSCR